MSKKIKIFFALAVLLAIPAVALAEHDEKPRQVIIGENEEIPGDFLDAGGLVDIAGKINGDVMLAGAELDFSGESAGDLLLAGANANVSGTVAADARIAACDVIITGKIQRNLSAIGCNLRLNKESVVSGNAYLAGANLIVKGQINGDLKIAASRVILAGPVEGDVLVYAKEIELLKDVTIKGNFTYYSSEEATIAEEAQIMGVVNKHLSPKESAERGLLKMFPAGALFIFLLWRILATLIVAWVAWKIFPGKIQAALDAFSESFWKKIGIGLVAVIVVPVGILIAIISLVGIPLGLIALAFYLTSLYLGMVLGVLLFGRWLREFARVGERASGFPYVTYFFGIVVISVISLVPVFGPLISFLVWLWGMGALVKALKS